MVITTCDMHTAGEPLRIVESGYPEVHGSTMLERLQYAKSNYDRFRQLLMNEPRGHYDMYGAILVKPYPQKEADFGVLFINNEGYSTMCGHAVIALGRYAVDNNLVVPKEPETLVRIDCPCGVVDTYVKYENKKSGHVRFHSVPAFLYKQDVVIEVKGFGARKVDISYGGAFYALVVDKEVGLDVKSSPLPVILSAASAVINAVKTQIPLYHPVDENLAFLYGVIITDDNGHISGRSSVNICVFADAQVDRSPTGSGVTARIAQLYTKGLIGMDEVKEFESLIGTKFTGKAVQKKMCGSFDAVTVEVCGMAYYTGKHTFSVEDDDPLPAGFKCQRI